MKQPYEMTRSEWLNLFEKATPDGMARYNAKNGRSETMNKLKIKEHLLFGIHGWIYNKAMKGIEWAIFAFDYPSYDKYDMVIKKAKEEGYLN